MSLTPKKLAFVAAYVERGGNAMQAALDAGYSKQFAYTRSFQLVRDEDVQALLARAGKRMEDRAILNGQGVVDALANIAVTDLSTFMRRDRDNNYTFKPPHELTPEQRAVIKTIEVHNIYGAKVGGKRAIIGQRFKYEIHDKFSALMALGKAFGTFGDQTPKVPNVTLNMFANMPQDKLEALQRSMQDALDGQFTKVNEESP